MLERQTPRRPRIFRPLSRVAEITKGKIVPVYKGEGDILLLWGYGGTQQRAAFEAHRKSGRHVVAIDLGYWDRGEGGIRFALDAWHPTPEDWEVACRKIKPGYEEPPLDDSYYDPAGHVLIAGLGKKSRRLLGFDGMAWEHSQVKMIREAFPGRRIVYRPKPNHEETIQGADSGMAGTINENLRGAALAVCLHSNVAIDCALLGIPCLAYDGVGRYGYGKGNAAAPIRLTGAARSRFLHGVSWFNWQPVGFGQMVDFIYELIEARNVK